MLEPDLRLDCNLSDPFERCKSGIFGSYSDFAKKNTVFKIKNSNNSTISSLKASRTLFRAYHQTFVEIPYITLILSKKGKAFNFPLNSS